MSEQMKVNVGQQELPVEADNKQPQAELLSLRPFTDIHETAQSAMLTLDLPGVSKESLDIDVDNNILTVKGAVNLHTPTELKPTYMEMHSGIFERRFTLGDELDCANIEATLKDGVLTMKIPLLPQHKPRKIEIKVA